MKLTKQQRHMAYMIMLAEAESPGFFYYEECLGLFKSNRFGFCGMIRMVFGINATDTEMPIILPELFVKKPVLGESYWFPTDESGWQSRISLLKQCITETADAWPK
ncbi:MAG: hypothetical protein JNK98_04105 [Chitinophagaceae bacterium]|nr:hypothetical protein [Chitinophagaceae bacterium]